MPTRSSTLRIGVNAVPSPSSCCDSIQNYFSQKKNHFLIAWNKNQLSRATRAYHLSQAIPVIDVIVKFVASFFAMLTAAKPSNKQAYITKLPEGATTVKELPNGLKIVQLPNGLKRIDRDYRVVDEALVPAKLEAEAKRAQISQNTQVDKPAFATARGDGFTRGPLDIDRPLATEHHVLHHHQGRDVHVDIASTQGRRPGMEDEHIATTIQVNGTSMPLFGVFDGHGGARASHYLKNHIATALEKFLKKGPLTDGAIFNALKSTFVDLDDQIKSPDGSTACVAFLLNGHLWVANSGDTRAVIEGPDRKIKQLSDDAKLEGRFARRVEKRGGRIDDSAAPFGGPLRINGELAVGGAIGDHGINGADGVLCVPARPKITKTPITPGNRLIIACDGVWDVATSRQVKGLTASNIVHKAYNAGSMDNISAMVATF